MNEDEVVLGLRQTAVDHNSRLMHRLSRERLENLQKELAELKASLNVIHATAGEIINAIQPPPPELTRDEPYQERQRRTNYRKSRKRK